MPLSQGFHGFFRCAPLAAFVLLTACGGGGGSGSDPGGAQANAGATPDNGAGAPDPVGTTVTSSGAITAFGSVFVNGVKFETDTADVEIEDESSTEADLRLGMRVRVIGRVNADGATGVAERIEHGAELIGPVGSVPVFEDDGSSLRFTVFDVHVVATRDDTAFGTVGGADAAFDIDTLTSGDVLRISGFFDGATRTLDASRIDKVERRAIGVSTVKLRGAVADLADDGTTFSIGDVLVTVGANTDLTELDNGLSNGLDVRVRGILTATAAVAATDIRPREDDLDDVADDDEVEFEGVVTALVDDTTIEIDGRRVDLTDATIEPAGATIALGTRVEVEGVVVAGVLVATEIEVRESRVKLHGRIVAIDLVGRALDIGVADAADPLSVAVDNRTSIRQRGSDDELEFEDLVLGDGVAIHAIDTDAGLLARTIKRRAVNDEPLGRRLDGRLEAFEATAGTLTVRGIVFATDANTEFEIEGELDDEEVSTDTFFAAVAIGDEVKIEDDNGDGVADSVELETDDAVKAVVVRGEVEAFDGVAATLTVGGARFATGDDTRFDVVQPGRRHRRIDSEAFFERVALGDLVQVWDRAANGVADAVRLHAAASDASVIVGRVTEIANDQSAIVVRQRTVAIDGETRLSVRRQDDQRHETVDAETFFLLLQVRSLVEVIDRDDARGADEVLLLQTGADAEEAEDDDANDDDDARDDDGVEVSGQLVDLDATASTIFVGDHRFELGDGTRVRVDGGRGDRDRVDVAAFFELAQIGDRVEVKDEDGDGVAEKVELERSETEDASQTDRQDADG